jgi:transposase
VVLGTAPSSLEARVSELTTAVEKLTAEREQYRKLYLELLERNALLERGIVAGRKAERFTGDDTQLTMQVLGMLLGGDEAAPAGAPDPAQEAGGAPPSAPSPEPTSPVRGHERRKPTGRKPLPQHLPRVRIEVLPPEVQQDGLAAFQKVGEEVSEVLERRPASLVVVELVRPRFLRKTSIAEMLAAETPEERPVIAEPPERPINRGLAGPGLLAATIVYRWQDSIPLHRQESIFARDGLELARSTICGWHETLADLAAPLVDAMMKDALLQPYLCIDATGALVRVDGQESKAKRKYLQAHFFVVAAPEKHILYCFSHQHNGAAVDKILGGYKGYLVADAHIIYDHLYTSGHVIEVGCWSHCRRYFFKALGSEFARAKHALEQIKAMYRIERELKTAPRKKREEIRQVRQEKTKPIVDAFFAWCDEQAAIVLDDTPLSNALRYARNQRVALSRFLDDGQLPLDNNISERNLRREVLGRKNWLFLGSDVGARANTTFVSLLASCQLHGIEPWAYLRDILCLLPSWPAKRILELAPAYWKQTYEQEDTQKRLAANVFRSVTLAGHASRV